MPCAPAPLACSATAWRPCPAPAQPRDGQCPGPAASSCAARAGRCSSRPRLPPGPAIPASGGPAGPGSSGMLIVMMPLAGTVQAAAGCAAAAGIVLVLLAAAAFALTRAILRPLREAAELAGSIAAARTAPRQPALTRCCNASPTKSPGWRRSQKDCTSFQPMNPPDRIANPPATDPAARRTTANRRPVLTTQRDRLSVPASTIPTAESTHALSLGASASIAVVVLSSRKPPDWCCHSLA